MKKYIIIVILILCLLITLLTLNKRNDFSGNINLKSLDIANNIESSTSINELGNYIYLMSPNPNDDEDTDWYNNPSLLIITNQNNKIQEAIELDGYFEELELIDENLYLFTRDNENTKYTENIHTPLIEKSTFKDGTYCNFTESSLSTKQIKQPEIGLAPNQITIISNHSVKILDDPSFEYNNHQYNIVDFTQNTNSIQTEASNKSKY